MVSLADFFVSFTPQSCFELDRVQTEELRYANEGLLILGVDAEAARNEEEQIMLRDAKSWLNSKQTDEVPHPKTGATALHVAAAKGYIKVMKWVSRSWRESQGQME